MNTVNRMLTCFLKFFFQLFFHMHTAVFYDFCLRFGFTSPVKTSAPRSSLRPTWSCLFRRIRQQVRLFSRPSRWPVICATGRSFHTALWGHLRIISIWIRPAASCRFCGHWITKRQPAMRFPLRPLKWALPALLNCSCASTFSSATNTHPPLKRRSINYSSTSPIQRITSFCPSEPATRTPAQVGGSVITSMMRGQPCRLNGIIFRFTFSHRE